MPCRPTSTRAPSAASDFEVYQSFSDEPLKKHAGCGGKLTKVFGPVGIVLKGSGFYKTDNRSSKAKAAARAPRARRQTPGRAAPTPASGSGSSDSGSGSGGSSDTTGTKKAEPAKKSDTKPAAKSKSA